MNKIKETESHLSRSDKRSVSEEKVLNQKRNKG